MKIILSEAKRNEKMINEYTKELESLPKGKLISKCINGSNYIYLYYRDGKKIISKYIGKNKVKIESLREQLLRRTQIEEILKKLKEEKVQIKKMEAML